MSRIRSSKSNAELVIVYGALRRRSLRCAAVALTRASRPSANGDALDFVNKWIAYGASVRAAQYLVLGSKARAITQGRYHVSFEDIRALAQPVMRHRVLTNFHAESEGKTASQLVDMLLEAVPVPASGM